MEIREMNERPTICIKTSTPVEKLSQVFSKGYGEIFAEAGKAGIEPAGAPYALYLNDDMSNLQIEFGFPAARPVNGFGGRVTGGTIPGGKTAVTLHEGPYTAIEEAYNRLAAFVKEKGLEPTGLSYEFYLNDPSETPPDKLKTEIYFPLKS